MIISIHRVIGCGRLLRGMQQSTPSAIIKHFQTSEGHRNWSRPGASVPTLPEISEEFFKRFLPMIRKRQVVLKTLESRYSKKKKRCHSDNMFFDFVHSETVLMGLLNYYKHYSAQAGQGVGFGDPQRMQQIVQPVRSFRPSCILLLAFRGAGRSGGGCDCC